MTGLPVVATACDERCTALSCSDREFTADLLLPVELDRASFTLEFETGPGASYLFDCVIAEEARCVSRFSQSFARTVFPEGLDGPLTLVLLDVGPGSVPSLTVTVRDDSGFAASASHVPDWETSYPNGPDCVPACHVAPTPRLELISQG